MEEFTFPGVTILKCILLFKPCLDDLHGKATGAMLALNSRYKFHKLLVNMALRCFDSLILPILLGQ